MYSSSSSRINAAPCPSHEGSAVNSKILFIIITSVRDVLCCSGIRHQEQAVMNTHQERSTSRFLFQASLSLFVVCSLFCAISGWTHHVRSARNFTTVYLFNDRAILPRLWMAYRCESVIKGDRWRGSTMDLFAEPRPHHCGDFASDRCERRAHGDPGADPTVCPTSEFGNRRLVARQT